MKKFFLFIITFLFLIFTPCFICHAEYLPSVNPDMTVVPDFLLQVGQMNLVNDTGCYTSPSDLNRVNQIVNGRSVQDSMQNYYVDFGAINSEFQPFYDSNGNLVPQSSTYGVFGNSDLGHYTFVASKETGEILYTYDELQEIFQSSLQAGNIQYPDTFPFSLPGINPNYNLVKEMYEDVKDSTMFVYGDSLDESDIQFLCEYDYQLTMTTVGLGWTCYCPNVCCSSTVLRVQQSNGRYVYEYDGMTTSSNGSDWYLPIIYTNDPSNVHYSGNGDLIGLEATSSNNSNVYGYHFNYKSRFIYGAHAPFWRGGFLRFKAPTEAEYQQYRQLSDNVVYLLPIDNTGEDTSVYNYSTVNNYHTNPTTNVNNSYDNSTTTNYYNYPVSNEISYPDFSTTNNTYVENVYNYYTSPNDDESVGNLDSSDLTDNIPILSNLKYRFPFSIPFDLYNLFKSFSVDRETLVFSGSISFGNYYTYDYNLDFSPFNGVAEICRTLFLLTFIIGLAYFSYTHFFGS